MCMKSGRDKLFAKSSSIFFLNNLLNTLLKRSYIK